MQAREPKTKTQMAEILGLSLRTFQRRLKEIELEIERGLISPHLQMIICEKLGYPHLIDKDDTKWHEKA